MLNVVRGNPSPEELAAVVAVVSARVAASSAAAAAAEDQRPPSVWAGPARKVRRMPFPGPGAWRSSAWPS